MSVCQCVTHWYTQVPTTTAAVQMKDGQLIPAGVFEGVVDPARVGPNGAEFSGRNIWVCKGGSMLTASSHFTNGAACLGLLCYVLFHIAFL